MMRTIFFLAVVAVLIPMGVSAHALGASYEAWVDGYHIDIGYNTPAPILGESVVFDFNFPIGTTSPTYTNIWLRIDDPEGGTVFAGPLYNTTFGGPRMSYVFGNTGTHTVFVRYENNGESIVSASFPMTVLPAKPPGLLSFISDAYLFASVGFVLGALCMMVLLRTSAGTVLYQRIKRLLVPTKSAK